MDWIAIGKRIRQQREYMGYTREQFAEQIDITPKFCSDIETGAKGMSVQTLCKIAQTLHLSTDYILWGKSGHSTPNFTAMMLENLSPANRQSAEKLLKVFVAALNNKHNE